MKKEYFIMECPYCRELNKVDLDLPSQECCKCKRKIVVPQQEIKIKNNNIKEI